VLATWKEQHPDIRTFDDDGKDGGLNPLPQVAKPFHSSILAAKHTAKRLQRSERSG